MAGKLFVISGQNERLSFDPGHLSFTAQLAPGDGYSALLFRPKPKPAPAPTEAKGSESKGSLPPPPVDLDMSFIGSLPDEVEANLLSSGVASRDVARVRGPVSLDHLKTWARDVPDGEHRVLILERGHGG